MIDLEVPKNLEAKIVVVGVGGAGNNAINRMIEHSSLDIDFIAINTDQQVLNKSLASTTITIGEKSTRGLGAGALPEIGKIAAEESKDAIAQAIKGADMVFITAGMGGGTGTGAAPIVADIAKNQGILTVAIVTKPFSFEGRQRTINANEGIERLKEIVDTLVVVPNDRVLDVIDEEASQVEALLKVDEILMQGVTGLANIIRKHAQINVDFADICTVMKDKGFAHLGVGEGYGKNRIQDAINNAINSPLLETSIEGSKSLLINIAGGTDLALKAVSSNINMVKEMLDTSANIIFGSSMEDDFKDKVVVTIVATDLKDSESNLNSTFIKPQINPHINPNTASQNNQNNIYNEYNQSNLQSQNQQNLSPLTNEKEVSLNNQNISNPTNNDFANNYRSNLKLDNEKLDIPTFLRRK